MGGEPGCTLGLAADFSLIVRALFLFPRALTLVEVSGSVVQAVESGG